MYHWRPQRNLYLPLSYRKCNSDPPLPHHVFKDAQVTLVSTPKPKHTCELLRLSSVPTRSSSASASLAASTWGEMHIWSHSLGTSRNRCSRSNLRTDCVTFTRRRDVCDHNQSKLEQKFGRTRSERQRLFTGARDCLETTQVKTKPGF